MTPFACEASRHELDLLWPAVEEAHVFADRDAFVGWWREAPWRVRLSEEGSAALLGRWRDHLPYAFVLGMWCPPAAVGPLLQDAVDVAREHGFERVVGPLVPEEELRPYRTAGFEEAQRIVVCRRPVRAEGAPPGAGGLAAVALRTGEAPDEESVLAVDASSFDDFWRYDTTTLRALRAGHSLVVAEGPRGPIGYTLWVCRGTEGTIARLAVRPEDRRRGVGGALLRETIARLARAGARAVTLTTQEDNAGARRLYAREAFRESPRRLVCTISSIPGEAGDRAGKE